MSSRCLEKPDVATLTTSSRHLQDLLESNRCLLEYIFVKHVIFSKLVNRLKACNFASKGIAKKLNIKLSENFRRSHLVEPMGENLLTGVRFYWIDSRI